MTNPSEAMVERLVNAARDMRDRFPPKLGCAETDAYPVEAARVRALEEALKPFAATPAAPVQDDDAVERKIFDEAVKRGVDQDTADQVAQAVAAALRARAA